MLDSFLLAALQFLIFYYDQSEFREIVTRIQDYSGNPLDVVINYIREIDNQLIDLGHFVIQPLDFDPYDDGSEPDIRGVVAIIMSMEREFSYEVANAAVELSEEISANNEVIPIELRVRILIFLHLILIRCDNLVDVPENRQYAVDKVRGSILRIFHQLPHKQE